MRRSLLPQTLALLATIVSACGERKEVFYANAVEAREARAIERGWIPAWIPRSARDIREIHDLDTNRSMLALSFDPAEVPKLEPSCRQIGRERLRPAPFRVAWWPNDVPPSAVATHRHVYYQCQDGGYVAAHTKDGELFHWRP
jgi:hypothetical protein